MIQKIRFIKDEEVRDASGKVRVRYQRDEVFSESEMPLASIWRWVRIGSAEFVAEPEKARRRRERRV